MAERKTNVREIAMGVVLMNGLDGRLRGVGWVVGRPAKELGVITP